MSDAIGSARIAYEFATLDERDVAADPLEQFATWLSAAFGIEGITEPNAMTLATVGQDSRPSARIVLLRGFDARGFTFFTNFESRKARELGANANAALVFYWGPLQRQIRIEGSVARIEGAESDAYFASRPRGSRLSAWASPQSTVVASRAELDDALAATERRFAEREVDRPAFWGGFRLVPERLEFWQGRRNRTHDRIAYLRAAAGWNIVRLAP